MWEIIYWSTLVPWLYLLQWGFSFLFARSLRVVAPRDPSFWIRADWMLRILLGLRLSRSPGLHPHAGELSHSSLLFSSGVPSVPKRPEEKLYLFLVLQLSLDCQHSTQGKTCLGQLFLVPFHPSDLCPLMFYCVMLHSCSYNLTVLRGLVCRIIFVIMEIKCSWTHTQIWNNITVVLHMSASGSFDLIWPRVTAYLGLFNKFTLDTRTHAYLLHLTCAKHCG